MSDAKRPGACNCQLKLRPRPVEPPLYMPAMPPLGLLTAIGNGIRILIHCLRCRRCAECDDKARSRGAT